MDPSICKSKWGNSNENRHSLNTTKAVFVFLNSNTTRPFNHIVQLSQTWFACTYCLCDDSNHWGCMGFKFMRSNNVDSTEYVLQLGAVFAHNRNEKFMYFTEEEASGGRSSLPPSPYSHHHHRSLGSWRVWLVRVGCITRAELFRFLHWPKRFQWDRNAEFKRPCFKVLQTDKTSRFVFSACTSCHVPRMVGSDPASACGMYHWNSKVKIFSLLC